MTSIITKKASIEDLETVQQIGIETFRETFSQENSQEAMQEYLDRSFATEKSNE